MTTPQEIINELQVAYENLLASKSAAEQRIIVDFKKHFEITIKSFLDGQSVKASEMVAPLASTEVSIGIGILGLLFTGLGAAIVGGIVTKGLTTAHNSNSIEEAQRLAELFNTEYGKKAGQAFCLQAILYHHERIIKENFETDELSLYAKLKHTVSKQLRKVFKVKSTSISYIYLGVELIKQFVDGLTEAERIFNHSPNSPELISYMAKVPEVISCVPLKNELNFTGSFHNLPEKSRYIIAVEAARLATLAEENKAIIDLRAQQWGYQSNNNTLFYRHKDSGTEGGVRCIVFSDDDKVLLMFRGPRGVAGHIKRLFDFYNSTFENLYAELQEHLSHVQRRNIKRVMFTGYGVGGELALQFGSRFYKENTSYQDKISIITFGQAPTQYTQSPNLENCVYRFVNSEDPISSISAIYSHIGKQYVLTPENISFKWEDQQISFSNTISDEILTMRELKVYRTRLVSHARNNALIMSDEPSQFIPDIIELNKQGDVVFSSEFLTNNSLNDQINKLNNFSTRLIRYLIEHGGLGFTHLIQDGISRVNSIVTQHIENFNECKEDRALKLNIILEGYRLCWWLKLANFLASNLSGKILELFTAIKVHGYNPTLQSCFTELVSIIDENSNERGNIFSTNDSNIAPLILIQSQLIIDNPISELKSIVAEYQDSTQWIICMSLLELENLQNKSLNQMSVQEKFIEKVRAMLKQGKFDVFKDNVAIQEWVLEDLDQADFTKESTAVLIETLSPSIKNLTIKGNKYINDQNLNEIVKRLTNIRKIKIQQCSQVKFISTSNYYPIIYPTPYEWIKKLVENKKNQMNLIMEFDGCENLNQGCLAELDRLMQENKSFTVNFNHIPKTWNPDVTFEFVKKYPGCGIAIRQPDSISETNTMSNARDIVLLPNLTTTRLNLNLPSLPEKKGLFALMVDNSLVAVSPNGIISRWRRKDDIFVEVQKLQASSKNIISIALLKNGNLLTASEDDVLRCWKINGGELLLHSEFRSVYTEVVSELQGSHDNSFSIYSEKRAKLINARIENKKFNYISEQNIDRNKYSNHKNLNAVDNQVMLADTNLNNAYQLLKMGLLKEEHIPILYPKTLTQLNVSGTKITDQHLKLILEQCPKLELKNVNINHCYFLTEKTLILKKIMDKISVEPNTLENLELQSEGLDDDELQAVLENFPKLRTLVLKSFNNFHGRNLESLQKNGLKKLTFHQCNNIDFDAIRKFTQSNNGMEVTINHSPEKEQTEASYHPEGGLLILPLILSAQTNMKCVKTFQLNRVPQAFTKLANGNFAFCFNENERSEISLYSRESSAVSTSQISQNHIITSMTVGSTGELYVGTKPGALYSYEVNNDGMLTNEKELGSLGNDLTALLEIPGKGMMAACGSQIKFFTENDNQANSEFSGDKFRIENTVDTHTLISALGMLSDGSFVCGLVNGNLLRYNLQNGKFNNIDKLQAGEIGTPSRVIGCITLSKGILISVTESGIITSWQLDENNLKKMNQVSSGLDIASIALSPDGGLLLITSQGSMQQWQCVDYQNHDLIIEDEETRHLHNARQLLERNILYPVDIPKIFKATSQKTFDISNTLITDKLLKIILNHCPKIKIIAKQCPYLTTEMWAEIAKHNSNIAGSQMSSSAGCFANPQWDLSRRARRASLPVFLPAVKLNQ